MKQIEGIDSNKFKILIVDDIPLNQILLEKMLQPYEFELVKANNGREALNLIEQTQDSPEAFDMAIVDLMMPDIDGYQVIETVRNGCYTDEFKIDNMTKEEFPIVILSGMNFNDDVSRGLALGANEFLTKPVVMERLYTAVEEELGKLVKSGHCHKA